MPQIGLRCKSKPFLPKQPKLQKLDLNKMSFFVIFIFTYVIVYINTKCIVKQ